MAIRCFIAIEVPEDLQEALGRVQKKLWRAAADVKWAAPETIHLTVKFLGDIGTDAVPQVCDVMSAVAQAARPMDLSLLGLGTFPADGTPRVVWAGLTGETEPLAKLVASLEEGLADAAGFAPEPRPFHPHLTLGRVRSARGADALVRAIAEAGVVDLGGFSADELVLFMSELTREGPLHTPMARARLGKQK